MLLFYLTVSLLVSIPIDEPEEVATKQHISTNQKYIGQRVRRVEAEHQAEYE